MDQELKHSGLWCEMVLCECQMSMVIISQSWYQLHGIIHCCVLVALNKQNQTINYAYYHFLYRVCETVPYLGKYPKSPELEKQCLTFLHMVYEPIIKSVI